MHATRLQATEGVDANFKTLVWNLSQNVDRTTGAKRSSAVIALRWDRIGGVVVLGRLGPVPPGHASSIISGIVYPSRAFRACSMVAGSGRPGICPCLTPSMVPYVTNRGGPLIGLEALSLQGIPIDDLLLTRESDDQVRCDQANPLPSQWPPHLCVVHSFGLRTSAASCATASSFARRSTH